MNAPAPIAAVTVGSGADEGELRAFLATMPGSSPFHSGAWGQGIEAATGHRWHLLAARDPAGALVGVLPLHHIRSRLFGDTLASAGFAVDGGILAMSGRVAEALAAAAVDLARALDVPTVELRGGTLPRGWTVDAASHLGFVRPLASDRNLELAAIPRKHRAEVRKSLAADLQVTVGRSSADRDAHYLVYATSVRNLGTPVFSRRLFDAALDGFGDAADILTVRHAGRPVASVLSLYWQGRVMPYWGGGTQAARGLRANERMYFELMDHARGRGMMQFDFGRSKTGSGPAAYKKNWGFDPVPLAYARWSAAGAAPRDINPTSAKYAAMVRIWQRMPLWLANRVGPAIARQLG